MEELKIDYKFNLEDFEIMEDIEHSYFPNDNITPAEEVLKWYQRNDLTCIGVRNSNNEVIASVNILPLNERTFYDIYNNEMNEADVIDSQIEIYESNKEYYLYLSSISINKNYRNNYRVITTLLKGCIDLYTLLTNRNIKIIKMMADASTSAKKASVSCIKISCNVSSDLSSQFPSTLCTGASTVISFVTRSIFLPIAEKSSSSVAALTSIESPSSSQIL